MTPNYTRFHIENGTVIDHIMAGQGLKIAHFLHLTKHTYQVTLALNLSSDSMQSKDIIYVDKRYLIEEEAKQVAILSPEATINHIKERTVIKKFKASVPETIDSLLLCPNPKCISNHERSDPFFYVKKRIDSIQVQCKYCKRHFNHEEFLVK